MSSNSHGYLVVVLPEDKIAEFERRFDQSQDDSYPNVKIELSRSAKRIDDPSWRQREYEIDCNHSVYCSLMDFSEWPGRKPLEELCKELGVRTLVISSVNPIDQFWEELCYTENSKMSYESEDYYASSNWVEQGWAEEDLEAEM